MDKEIETKLSQIASSEDVDEALKSMKELEKKYSGLVKEEGKTESLKKLKQEMTTVKEKFQRAKMDSYDKGYMKSYDEKKAQEENPPMVNKKYIVAAVVLGAVAGTAYLYMKKK